MTRRHRHPWGWLIVPFAPWLLYRGIRRLYARPWDWR